VRVGGWREKLGGGSTAGLALAVLLAAGIALRLGLMLAWSPGFLANGDTRFYIGSAHGNLFDDLGRPAGYPLFLHVAHALWPAVTFTILVQHALGVATALLLFVTVRRVAPAAWGLLPAGVVLLAGPQLFLEHALLSESLFAFLAAAVCYCAVRALDSGPVPWGLLAGLLAACAACVRSVGLVFVAVVVVWLVASFPAPLRRRLAVGGVAALAAWVVLAVYVVEARREAGYVGPGLTRVGGLHAYSGVGPFADCRRFTPPPGTRGLCERRPFSQRPGPIWYQLARGSPPGRLFRTQFALTPDQDRRLAAFARAVVLNQPLDYLEHVGKELTRFWDSERYWRARWDGESYPNFMGTLWRPVLGDIVAVGREWYTTGDISRRDGLWSTYQGYERSTRLEGPAFLLLVLLMLGGLPLARGRRLAVGLLLAAIALAALVTPIAATYFDARFAVPGYGTLAAAAAVGAASLWERAAGWRARRVPVHAGAAGTEVGR
jgi:hypothetical protein